MYAGEEEESLSHSGISSSFLVFLRDGPMWPSLGRGRSRMFLVPDYGGGRKDVEAFSRVINEAMIRRPQIASAPSSKAVQGQSKRSGEKNKDLRKKVEEGLYFCSCLRPISPPPPVPKYL